MILISKKLDDVCKNRIKTISNLKENAHVHLIGICGTGMASVMTLLKDLGFYVTGSDKAFYPPMGDIVKRTADKVFTSYCRNNLKDKPDLVVIGNALSKDNEEVSEAINLGIPFASMPEVFSAFLIGDYNNCKTSVVVTGTHGKTTTTSAIASILETANKKPGFFIGGKPSNFSTSIRVPDKNLPTENRIVVLEGDEYDSAFFSKFAKFQHYRPDILTITSLEFDHADIYRSVEEIEQQFLEVSMLVPKDGAIIVCDQGETLNKFVEKIKSNPQVQAKIIRYGFSSSSDYYIKEILPEQFIVNSNKRIGQKIITNHNSNEIEFFTTLSGKQNALNLLCAKAVCNLLDLSDKEIISGIKNFKGVSRRQEIVLESNGITLIDDFAHHPTAVKFTLEGIKNAFPESRLIAVFEPRSNTTRKGFFLEEYIEAFFNADVVKILEVSDSGYSQFSSNEKPLNVKVLVSKIRKRFNIQANDYPSVDMIHESIINEKKLGDVIVVMSNGDFGGLVQKLSKSINP